MRYLATIKIHRVFILAATVFCTQFLVGCSWTNGLIFYPPRISYTTDNCELVQTKDAGSGKVAVRYFHNPDAKYTLLYSHGNAVDIGRIFSMMGTYRKAGFSVLCYDYPGYGLSNGKPTEKGAYRSAETAYLHLTTTLNIKPDRIILVGRSVGGGPACYLAEKYDTAGLILISPFVSAYRVVTKYPLIPFDKFKNLSRIDEINMPLLIIHGTNDGVIPFWHGKKLFDAAKEPKYFYALPGIGHNNLFLYRGTEVLRHIGDFAKTLEPAKLP